MRLLWYDLQDPIDPQVNGFAFYRTVVDGATPLLVARKEIPAHPLFACTHPWEAADTPDETLCLLPVLAGWHVFGTDTNPSACTTTQPFEMVYQPHANSHDYPAGETVSLFGYRWMCAFEEAIINKIREAADNALHVQNGMTWAFASQQDDDDLGGEVEYDNDPPIGNHLLTSFQEHIFVAGNPDSPHSLYWSKRFFPESFPTDNFVEVGTADDPIQALVPIAGVLGIFTVNTKYRISGNATTGFVHFEAISRRGTRFGKSATPTDKGIIFVANDGVFVTNLIGPDTKLSAKIEPLFNGETVGDELPIDLDEEQAIAGAYFKTRYYFTFVNTAGAHKMAVYAFDSEEWTIYDHEGESLFMEADTDLLTMGTINGYVFALESGTTDSTVDDTIAWSVSTKSFSGQSYNTRSLFLYFKVDAVVPTGREVEALFYVDGVLKQTTTITGDRTNVLNRLPPETFGYQWRVELSGADERGTTKLFGVAALFIPLGVS